MDDTYSYISSIYGKNHYDIDRPFQEILDFYLGKHLNLSPLGAYAGKGLYETTDYIDKVSPPLQKMWSIDGERIVMDTGNPEVEKAFSIFFNFNTGFGGMGETYGKKDKSLYGTYRKNVSNLLKAEPKIRRMKIENMDFRELIDKYDDHDTFFYLDPPYPGKDWYVHNFLESDFIDLKKVIGSIEGTYLMNFNSIDGLPVKVFGKPSFVKEYRNENGKPGVTSSRKVSFYTNSGIKL